MNDTTLLLTLFSVLDNAPTVEAIPKDQYQARLKADMVAMLTEIQLDIEEQEVAIHTNKEVWNNAIAVCSEIIQEKIKTLTENKDGTNEKTSD